MTTLPAVVRIIDLPAYTTVTGGEVVEAIQTVGGVQISVQMPLTAIITTSMGALPTGGATGQLLAKTSGTNFVSNWSSISSFVSVNTASSLVTTGTATAIVIGVATGGISSTQIANNAVGTNQLASSLGIASSLSVGTLLTVGGTATFNGTAIFNATAIYSNGLQVTGTSLLTGTFGVVGTALFTSNTFGIVGTTLVTGSFGQVGTSLMTGLFGVSGTAAFTGSFGIVGTTLVTGRVGIVGTTLVTGFFSVVGTSQFTGTFGIAGTTIVTGTLGLSSLTAGVIVASSTGVLSNQGGMVLLNTLSPSAVASTNDTTSFTAAYRTYMFVIDDLAPVNNTVTLQMTVATSGASFVSGGYAAFFVTSALGAQYSTTSFLLSGIGATTSVSSSTLYGVNGVVYLHNPSSSVSRKSVSGFVTYAAASAALGTASIGGGSLGGIFDGASNPVTGVNFAFSAGNIATGTIRIYGVT